MFIEKIIQYQPIVALFYAPHPTTYTAEQALPGLTWENCTVEYAITVAYYSVYWI